MDTNTFIANHTEPNISKLREILKEKYKLDVPTQCDKFLGRCLRQKDGNLEKAAKLAQAIHQLISDIRNWNAKLDPSCYESTCYKPLIYCPLAAKDNLGRRILVVQCKLWDPDKISFDETAAALWMMSQIEVNNEEYQKHGYVVIFNFDDISLRQARAVNHRILLKVYKWAQGGVMGRVKPIHYINHPKIIGLLYEGIKPFLSEKMKNRIKIHKSLTELQESFDMEHTSLPKFLGGDLEVEDCVDEEFMKNLLNSAGIFQDMLKNGFPVE